ncbi:MAG: LapA family protein [Luteimonas sp.]
MRLIRFLIALLFVAAGVAVGALNPQLVAIDLGFMTLSATLGVTLLVCMLLGAILGGLMLSASVVLPLRRQLRRSRDVQSSAVSVPTDDERD